MSEPTFQIVFRGKILTGFDRDQVRNNLGQLFKIDARRVDALLDAPKTVLKTGLSREPAARYQEALRQAGIMVAVIGESAAVDVAVITPPSPSQPASTTAVPPPASTKTEERIAAPTNPAELTLAAAGERILPPSVRPKAEIDTSSLSLAQVGAVLVDHRRAVAPRQYDLSGISIATDGSPIDAKPKAPPAVIDVSALSLAELPPEPEKAPSELQKLLSTSID